MFVPPFALPASPGPARAARTLRSALEPASSAQAAPEATPVTVDGLHGPAELRPAADTIESIRGLEGLRAHDGFREWIPRLVRGDRVGTSDDHRALVGYGIAEIEGQGEVWSGLDRLRRQLSVVLQKEGAGVRSPCATAP